MHLCWLRQRYTYPATLVASLSKGDAAAVTPVSTLSTQFVSFVSFVSFDVP